MDVQRCTHAWFIKVDFFHAKKIEKKKVLNQTFLLFLYPYKKYFFSGMKYEFELWVGRPALGLKVDKSIIINPWI